jgi:peptide/nickel transport system permease protein
MRGIAALKAGDTRLSRELLSQAVKQEPQSESAWFWLSAVLKTAQGRAFCLGKVLEIDPANQRALHGLGLLEKQQRAPVLVAQSPPRLLAPPESPGQRIATALAQRLRRQRTGLTASTASRVAKYALVRMSILSLTVMVGVFLAIVFINFGGFIDEIYRDGIEWALMGMSREMHDVPHEEKAQLLDQARWQMEENAGLHTPFLWRCALWLRHGLTLNWEDVHYITSWGEDSESVLDVILERLPNTLLLAGASNLLLFVVGVLVALTLSRRYGNWLDRTLIALSPISSAPNWVYGVILTIIFAAQLHLLPLGGKYDALPPDTQFGYVWVVLKHMILPVAAIFLSVFFQSVYAWRTYFLIHAEEDYVELAVAQGLPPRMIERRYILRPTLPYVLTSFTLLVIGFWQNAMALEVFFDWPGIGSLFVESVWSLSSTTVISLVVIFAYLLAISVFVLDIAYALVDPRVKTGNGHKRAGTAARRVKKRLNLRLRRSTIHFPQPRWHTQLAVEPATSNPLKATLAERVRHRLEALKPALCEIRRYPSAIVGLVIIMILAGISVYTVIAIPYQEAIRLWRPGDTSRYQNPEYAQPEWTNLFRKHDLPRTIVRSSLDGTAGKTTTVVSEEMTQITIPFVFDYPYQGFPQDLTIFLKAEFEEKRPFISMVLLTPDEREIELESFSMTSEHTYRASADTRLRRKSVFGGEGVQPMKKLLAAEYTASATAVQGTYQLRVDAFVFQEGDDVEAEMVLYGQVHGLAGTDHQRRDLMIAMLWGAPIALAFGLVGAVCTSLVTMLIAGVGVWFGGWLDTLIQRVGEVNLMLPALPIAITVYLIYAKSIWVILGVMVLLSIFGTALKNYRAMFLQVKESAYIEAARAYGASNRRIIFRYLLPRIAPVLIPQLVIMIPGYVFLEATLAFLGVSDVYLPTWGKVINDALTHNIFQGHYYWVLEPVALLLLTGLAFAMVGFALDSIFNPRLREM